MSRFKPLKFSFGKIHFSGGWSDKSHPLTTKQAAEPGSANTTFVKFHTGEVWLIMATTGQTKSSASAFGRTSLLDELRAKVVSVCNGVDLSADATIRGGGEYDPMAEVAAGRDNEATSSAGPAELVAKRARYYMNHARERIATFSMLVRCPEEDPNCTEFRTIRMYIADRRQLWLDIADVEWAVKYLYAQVQLKGVPLVPANSTGPGTVP